VNYRKLRNAHIPRQTRLWAAWRIGTWEKERLKGCDLTHFLQNSQWRRRR